jgi:hypothetical protein
MFLYDGFQYFCTRILLSWIIFLNRGYNSVVTRLWAGLSGVRVVAGARDFSFLQDV